MNGQDQNDNVYQQYLKPGQKEWGMPQQHWDALKQQAFQGIAGQYEGEKRKLAQQQAAMGAPGGGGHIGGSRMLASDQAGAMGKVSTQMAHDQQTMALQDRWQALEAGKHQASLDQQKWIAEEQNKIQRQLAENQTYQTQANLHAQATEIAMILQNQGMNISDSQVLAWLQGRQGPQQSYGQGWGTSQW